MKIFKRRLLSQNFLRNPQLITELIGRSSIGNKDYVIEIGAGLGIITKELIKKAGHVVAIEVDPKLFNGLKIKFSSIQNIDLVNMDFLKFDLPVGNYKVFSNIPFIITSEIIKKLTFDANPLLDCYLVVQIEAAKKFVGKPLDYKNSQASILLKPFFDITVVYKFNYMDFQPSPNVATVLLRIQKRNVPLIDTIYKKDFEQFVIYVFNQTNPTVQKSLRQLNISADNSFNLKPSELSIDQWLLIFKRFQNTTNDKHKMKVKAFVENYQKNQMKLKKINRTRTDKNWRKFK